MTDDITKDLAQQSHSDKLDLLINLVTDMRDRQDSFEQQLAGFRTEMTGFRTELTELRDLVYARLSDTRPIWTAVQAQLEKQQQQLDDISAHLQRHDERFDRHDERFDRLESLLREINEDTLEVKGRQRRLEKRVTDIEQRLAA